MIGGTLIIQQIVNKSCFTQIYFHIYALYIYIYMNGRCYSMYLLIHLTLQFGGNLDTPSCHLMQSNTSNTNTRRKLECWSRSSHITWIYSLYKYHQNLYFKKLNSYNKLFYMIHTLTITHEPLFDKWLLDL